MINTLRDISQRLLRKPGWQRKRHGFNGGIHPPINKAQSLREQILIAPVPKQLVLPLSQHIGKPALPVVQAGDRVLKGQLIAAADGLLSARLHAPSSGLISAIELRPVPHASGLPDMCIVLDCDGKDEWHKNHNIKQSNYSDTSPDILIKKIFEAGISGLGGAGYPTERKISGSAQARIHTLIINAAECEPYISADEALMRERAVEIKQGIEILQYILKPTHCLIGIEDTKREAIEQLLRATADSDIEIIVIPTKYPSGGERQLIRILTGQEVPAGKLPADIGILCQNIGTVYAIYRAIICSEPLISRITTVTGAELDRPRNVETLLGTPAADLLALCGSNDSISRLIVGGPLMGFVAETDIPVIKTTNCLLAPSAKELPPAPPAEDCIHCGLCVEVCPAGLLPQQLNFYSQNSNHEQTQKHNLFDCIECGACAWVCPSHIPLVQVYRTEKAAIREQQANRVRSDYWRNRFEFRQLRLINLATEREQQKAERLQARRSSSIAAEAADNSEPVRKTDEQLKVEIQAAVARAREKKAELVRQSNDGHNSVEHT
jgi:electron transport complex protein RnfC